MVSIAFRNLLLLDDLEALFSDRVHDFRMFFSSGRMLYLVLDQFRSSVFECFSPLIRCCTLS